MYYSVFSLAYERSLFNDSGERDTRFSPLTRNKGFVPTLYAANTRTAALLETAFHEVQPTDIAKVSRVIDLKGRGIRLVDIPDDCRLIDLRDDRLLDLEISRSELVATSAAHYVCTREWGQRFYEFAKRPQPVGVLWQSRVAEIAAVRSPLFADLGQSDYAEVMILFEDRIDPGSINSVVECRDLSSPKVASLIESIADELGAVIV